MNSLARLTRWHLIALLILVIDQGVKTLVDLNTPLGWSFMVTEFFNLVHVLNTGAAFSFLAAAGGWQRWFFLAIALAVSAWLFSILRKPRDPREALSLSLILGGALGNALDRAARGHVIDYLDFHLWGSHWPAFNLADIAITLGAVLMVFASLLPSRTSTSKPVRT